MSAPLPKYRQLNPGAYGFCIRSAGTSHVRLYPYWMTLSLDTLYAEAVKITESIDYEASVSIYSDGFEVGTLRGQI